MVTSLSAVQMMPVRTRYVPPQMVPSSSGQGSGLSLRKRGFDSRRHRQIISCGKKIGFFNKNCSILIVILFEADYNVFRPQR